MSSSKPLSQDEIFMSRALSLARLGEGFCHPNPMVGAVLVKNGQILGEGYHAWFGGPHAEAALFASLTNKAASQGATLYVTLEPCCHTNKKTPPCVPKVISSGVSRVVIATLDVNPEVSGKGAQLLREAGIKVDVGVLERQSRYANRIFEKHVTTSSPYVLLKAALTMDGKMALSNSSSKWITSSAARERAQLLRHRYQGVVVGVGTVLADDPQLTARGGKRRSPARIILDRTLRTPLESHIVQEAGDDLTYILTSPEASAPRKKALTNEGVRVLELDEITPKTVAKTAQDLGLDSLLVEGGAQVLSSFLLEQVWDEAELFVAPRITGDLAAPTPFPPCVPTDLEQTIPAPYFIPELYGRDVCFHFFQEEPQRDVYRLS